jgi:hypothetical protein
MNPRWHTFSPGIPAEEAERQRILSAIDDWWSAFAARCGDILALFTGQQEWDLTSWMHDTLQAINPHLMWEFGPGLEHGHRLVITPEYRFGLSPLVEEILGRAPELEDWSFFGHRLAEPCEHALAAVEARTGVPSAATGLKWAPGQFGMTNIAVEFPKAFLRENEDLALHHAFVFVETLLGEEALNIWTGQLSVQKKSWGGKRLAALPKAIQEAWRVRVSGLRDTPFLEADPEEATWVTFKGEPAQADDFPAQQDLFVGLTMAEDVWSNAHSGWRFDSVRHSRVGEVFCYLKMDGSEELDGTAFGDRAEIEDALNDRLRPASLGCVLGGGTGLRYSYVDFALMNVEQAVKAIRDLLQQGNLSRRSWLLFHDTDWRYEWIGIWDDSPRPFLVDADGERDV